MGKTHKPQHGEQTTTNAYEKMKMLRIQENKARMKEMRLEVVAHSLTSLVDNRRSKKRKGKFDSAADDLDYVPDLDDGDLDEQDNASIRSPRKMKQKTGANHQQFIAPLFMKNHATLMQRRQGTVCGQGDLNEHQRKKSDRTNMTLGEMILSKKHSQAEKVHKEKAPASSSAGQSCGVKRKLFSTENSASDQNINRRFEDNDITSVVRQGDEENEPLNDDNFPYE